MVMMMIILLIHIPLVWEKDKNPDSAKLGLYPRWCNQGILSLKLFSHLCVWSFTVMLKERLFHARLTL